MSCIIPKLKHENSAPGWMPLADRRRRPGAALRRLPHDTAITRARLAARYRMLMLMLFEPRAAEEIGLVLPIIAITLSGAGSLSNEGKT
jgi:hypothetical protein